MSEPGRHGLRDGLEFRLLGPFEVRDGGEVIDVGGSKHRALLAALLLRAGQPVPVNDLAEAVWGEAVPRSPRRVIQLYVMRLRRKLGVPAEAGALTRSADGYRIDVGVGQVDLLRFRAALERAACAARNGDLDGEAAALAGAVGEWRGRPLAGVPSELLQREAVPALSEEWLQAVERRVDAELRRGRHAEVLGELLGVTVRYPLRERLWAQLITALYRCDRRGDALTAYHTLRHNLAGELGIDPGEDLQLLYGEVLAGRSAGQGRRVPRQLPTDLPAFTGRAEEVAALDGLLAGPVSGAATAVAVITGTAGVGKSALAAHWARRVADNFPDGQLWMNLRGFGPGAAVTTDQALTRFLRALGLPDAEIPPDVDDRAALYRSLLDGRRVLVVLDDAFCPEQVRPLLPGAPGCFVLVTSRRAMSGLVAAADAHPLVLDLLNDAQATRLLARRLDPVRVDADPSAVTEIVTSCARLPLALAVVAARAAAHPGFGLDQVAGELRATRGSLDAFASQDPATDLRAVFGRSYDALSAPAARLFRLLGLHPGPDIGAAAVASLAGMPAPRAGALLAELCDAHLVTERAPGRYEVHELLRVYAGERGRDADPPAAGRQGRLRMYDHYLHTARNAALTRPSTETIAVAPPRDGVTVEDIRGHRRALSWFTGEREVLLALVDQAAATGFGSHVRRLAWTLGGYLYRRGDWDDWVRVLRTALDAATPAGGLADQARAHRELARAYAHLGRAGPASEYGERALKLSAWFGDPLELANSHRALSAALRVRRDPHGTLRHDLRALDLYEGLGHAAGTGRALNAVGRDRGRLGDLGQGLTCCERALAVLTEIGDLQGQAATWDSLGFLHRRLGHQPRAVACYQHAVDLRHDLGDRYHEARSLACLGDAQRAAGSRPAAVTAWRRAEALLTEAGHHDVGLVRMRLCALESDQYH